MLIVKWVWLRGRKIIGLAAQHVTLGGGSRAGADRRAAPHQAGARQDTVGDHTLREKR